MEQTAVLREEFDGQQLVSVELEVAELVLERCMVLADGVHVVLD